MTNSKGGTSTKVGNTLAKLAGIKKNYRDPIGADTVTRGESTFSVGTSDTYAYVEQEPSSADWLRELVPTGQKVVQYFANLFPFLRWITRYNLQWLIGDLVAGKFCSNTTTQKKAVVRDSNPSSRYHCGRGCGAAEHGIRKIG